MIDPKDFYQKLIQRNIAFFCGVPDSLLSDFIAFLVDHANRHIITANEGNAIALAAGSYLASGHPSCVYLQNSGQGNIVNPLVSLADPSVYGIPMILLVGWRGEPGKKDEPQHMNQGMITETLFKDLGMICRRFPTEPKHLAEYLDECINETVRSLRPIAMLVSKGSFMPYRLNVSGCREKFMRREDAIAETVEQIPEGAAIVSTTGMISRELYSLRRRCQRSDASDFLTVGSMGHASQIAMGVAMEQPDRAVFCFDGDGAVIMHMGALALIGTSRLRNFHHIVFNNAAYDSVGGQPTVANQISLTTVAKGCGYAAVHRVTQKKKLRNILRKKVPGPIFIEVIVSKGSRSDLDRPSNTPSERKSAFMDFLRN